MTNDAIVARASCGQGEAVPHEPKLVYPIPWQEIRERDCEHAGRGVTFKF